MKFFTHFRAFVLLMLIATLVWAQGVDTSTKSLGQTPGSVINGPEQGRAYPLSSPSPVQLQSAVSRMTHGSSGTFDIDLPLSGPFGIECRRGGDNGGNFTLIFAFNESLNSVDAVTVTNGIGSVSSGEIDPNDGHNYIVSLTGVANAQFVTATLHNVRDSIGDFSSSTSATMGVLLADTNADGAVNAADTGQTKAQSGNLPTNSNFRTDVNTDGFINVGDVILVRDQSGTALPAQPSPTPAPTPILKPTLVIGPAGPNQIINCPATPSFTAPMAWITGEWGGAINTLNLLSLSGGGAIDYFNSNITPTGTFLTSPPTYRSTDYSQLLIGLANANNSDLRSIYVYGGLSYSTTGAVPRNTVNVQGPISTPFIGSIPAVIPPSWPSGSFTSFTGGGTPPFNSTSAIQTANIKINGDFTVPSGRSVLIVPGRDSNNNPITNFTIWVTGRLVTAGSGLISQDPSVTVTWYVGGNIALVPSGYSNGSARASAVTIYGYGSGASAVLSGSGNFIGSIYVPTYNTTLSGSSNWVGALVANTFSMAGNASFHYDDALNPPTCSGVTVVMDSDVVTPGNCPANYTEIRTWHAIDNCGDSTGTVSQSVTVVDTAPPTIGPPGANATIGCGATPNFTPPTASDTCSSVSVVQTSDTTTYPDPNTIIYQRCWQAVDACGNQSPSVCQTITASCLPTPTPTPAG